VPALIVSPYIPKLTVDATVRDHTSIATTVREAFGIEEPLTDRDKSMSGVFDLLVLEEPRDPVQLPPAPPEDLEELPPPSRALLGADVLPRARRARGD